MAEQMIAVNGAMLWVAEQGAGVPIMLCSGGPGCCDYLGPVAAMIDDIAHVYRFEARGCGRSTPDGRYDLQTTLADLDGLRAHFNHDRWIIAGHSAGAELALAYALTYPERVLGLIHLSGMGVQDDRQWHDAYEAGKENGQEVLPEFAYPFNLEVNRAARVSWKMFIKEPMLLRTIAASTVPSLLVFGDQDIRLAWPVEQLANLLPYGRYELIADAGHHIELTQPDALKELLRAFVTERIKEPAACG